MKNYSLIAKGVNDLLVEAYEKKDKKTINNLLTEIKGNKALKILYTVVDNLQNGEVLPKNVDNYIQENIKVCHKTDFSQFDKMLTTLGNTETTELLDNIGCVLFERKSVFNLSRYNKAYEAVSQHLIDLSTWEEKTRENLQKLSESYDQLEKEEKLLFEKVAKTPKDEQANVLVTEIDACVSELDRLIEASKTSEEKVNLYEAKDKVLAYKKMEGETMKSLIEVHTLRKELVLL